MKVFLLFYFFSIIFVFIPTMLIKDSIEGSIFPSLEVRNIAMIRECEWQKRFVLIEYSLFAILS